MNAVARRTNGFVRGGLLLVTFVLAFSGMTMPVSAAPGVDRSQQSSKTTNWLSDLKLIDSATGACRVTDAQLMIRGGGDQDWSHVTDRIVYDYADTNKIFQLATMNPDGSGKTCLTCAARSGAPAVNQHKFNPSWYPNGQGIVVQVEMKSHWLSWLKTQPITTELLQNGLWNDLYYVNADGTKWQKLTNTSGAVTDGVLAPVFSPDGTKLMWSRLVEEASNSAPFGKWRLMLGDFALNAGTASLTNVRDITPAGSNFIESHGFSPDSSSVLVTTDLMSKGTWEKHIWLLHLDTGDLQNVSPNNHWNEHAYFSPDGSKLAYMSSLPFLWSFMQTEVILADPDGSNPVRLTHFNTAGYPESTSETSAATRIRWNADGTKMAVTQQMKKSYPARNMWILTFAGNCGVK